ncbi:MAG TPA: malto-oligosyltrehalose synthase [Eoetvoesiella sp.]
MTIPRATLRLQFHAGFTLDDACAQVPYFSRLGISHLYASPLTQARPGSTHGYDVVDPTAISADLGGEAALKALVSRLHEHDMGLILDIVPNHMATHAGNPWWWSVLKHGQQSPYAFWFDIDWNSEDPDLRGKILAPFLGKIYGRALQDGDITLQFDTPSQRFQIHADGAPYPIAPGTLNANKNNSKQVLAQHDPSTEQGRQHLHDLLEKQHYRLAWWRCAADQINWRRFFEISDLIGLCVEHPDVFNAIHALPLRLYEQGLIDGLRIDHIDGLAYPGRYCERLLAALTARTAQRSAPHEQPYLIVEKILAHDEVVDDNWKVHGTTGYDFMDQASALLHAPEGEAPLTALWERLSGDTRPRQAVVEQARKLMLQRHFPAERRALVRALRQLVCADPATRDYSAVAIKRVIDQLLVNFSVYRSYANDTGRTEADAARFGRVLDKTRIRLHLEDDGDDLPLLEKIAGWLSGEAPTSRKALYDEAIRRFQQFTPPLAAKALEDTVFYRYGRLLSRNEVGSDLKIFALSPQHFHRHCLWRAAHAPQALLATATHDHKRGEDVRARLAVLSEIPDLWAQSVSQWMVSHCSAARSNGTEADKMPMPHPIDLYMFYQTVIGAWPLDLHIDDKAGMQAYTERLVQWQSKALREAKVRSSWFAPNLKYEETCAGSIRHIMLSEDDTPLVRDLWSFAQTIAAAGAVNSLTQTVLRMTVPGVPDLYQGTEFWDFSLVDPDNRRPVDFSARAAALDAPASTSNWRTGHIKQTVIQRCLQVRRENPALFRRGNYEPLRIQGVKADHALTFSRRFEKRRIVVVAPRRTWRGVSQSSEPNHALGITPEIWCDTYVELPVQWASTVLVNRLNDARLQIGPDARLILSDALRDCPVGLFTLDQS